MNPLLERLMEKRGIKSVDDLDPMEKATYERWQSILGDEVSVETIKTYCEAMINDIEEKFSDLDNTPEKTSKLILLHGVYKGFLNVISAPSNSERASLEAHLSAMLHE